MSEKRIEIRKLEEFCAGALTAAGMEASHAAVTAKVLTWTDSFHVHSHGAKNLYNYIRKIRQGGMELNACPRIEQEGASFALVDAGNGIGMVAGTFGMDLAVKKARENGVSAVCVRNSEHFGAAGYYAFYAATQDMIAISMSNVDANMAVPGSSGKVIGNNPFSYGVPAKRHHPLFFDVAMSSVASLKVIQARKDGVKIPTTWIVDKDGQPTDDPSHYPEEGAMQPMAAHKGYGLAFMVEIMTGILGGSAFMTDIPSWLFCMPKPNQVSHTFICMDPSKFGELDEFKARVDEAIDRLHSAPLAVGCDHIYYPGEIEWSFREDAEENGIRIPADVEIELKKLSKLTGVSIEWKV